MFELRDVYKTYAENYKELRGRAPTARALAYCEKVVDHAEKMYLSGKRDAENSLMISRKDLAPLSRMIWRVNFL